MSRVALLIGVSRYLPGLNPLPKAQKDVEVLRRVLKQPQFNFATVDCLSDRSLTEMQEAIETFFRRCRAEDQILFFFTGYVMQEDDGRLYFATPETHADEQGRLIKARSMPASFVQEAMNRSAAQQQVVILDCYFRQSFRSDPETIEAPVDVQAQLGSDRRVILTASAWTHHLAEPEDLDTWSYTRYLAEGIATGAADRDSNSILTPEDLHNYVRRKLKIAAPAMDPQIYGSQEVGKQSFLQVPPPTAAMRYRKVLEDLVEQGEVDITASTLLTHRSLLDDVKYSLGLSADVAREIESQALQPVRDYRQRLQSYEEQFSGTSWSQDVSTPQNRLHLKQIQKALGLTDSDTAAIDAAPYVAEQQMQREQYQKNLASYEQILLAAMRRQFPLAEGDRHVLQRLQQALQLREEDAQTIQTQLMAQMQHQRDFAPPSSTSEMETKPPIELDQRPSSGRGVPPIDTRTPPTPRNLGAPLAEQIPRDDTIPPHLVRPVSYSTPEAYGMPEQTNRPPEPPPRTNIAPPSEGTPANAPAPPPMSPPPKSSARSYTALIIPGILLAAIIGTLAAMWSSANFSKMLGGGSQPSPSSTDTQTSLQKAADLTRRGITAEGIGYLDEAIRSYSDAIDLIGKSCNQPATPNGSSPPAIAPSNSSPSCRLLARTYNNRSYAYFRQKDFSRALNDASQAIALDPKLAEARINLANARFKKGDLTGALKDYDQALQSSNLSKALKAGVYNNRGNIHFAQNDIKTAINDYTQAIKLSPNYADAYYNRGLAYSGSNPTSAINDFEAAAKYYREKKNFNQGDEAQKKATDLQQRAPNQTPLPPSDTATPKG